jgi:hypothetical protein
MFARHAVFGFEVRVEFATASPNIGGESARVARISTNGRTASMDGCSLVTTLSVGVPPRLVINCDPEGVSRDELKAPHHSRRKRSRRIFD